MSICGNLSLSHSFLDVFALSSRLVVVVRIGSRLVVHKAVWCLPELEPFFFFFIDDAVDRFERCGFLLHQLCIAVTPSQAGTTIPR